MEAFEQFVAVALESEGFVVSPAVKFRVQRRTRKAGRNELQTHGYEVDLVAARADRLVLATVKSFFGSRGVVAAHVLGQSQEAAHYRMLNDKPLRTSVIKAACRMYGYRLGQVQVRLYVGKFAAPKRGTHEAKIREWCARQRVGGGPIEVVGVAQVVAQVMKVAASRQYRDNSSIVALKVLEAAGVLALEPTPNAE